MEKPSNINPPKWAEKFLEWYCDPDLLEDLQGDLHERFMYRIRTMNLFKAKLLYLWDVLVFIKPYTLRKKHKASFFFLFGSYLKPSYRSLWKNKLHTSLIIFGLSTSIAVFALLLMYVNDELKFDRHYDKADRIYKITSVINSSTANSHVAWTDGFLGQRLKELYPEVEESVHMVKITGKTSIQYDDKTFTEEQLYRAEQTYFGIFSHSWITGNPETALAYPKQIVLTQKLAEKYFGKQAPLNKTIKVGADDYTVTGVIQNLPSHTDLKFDAILSTDYEYLVETNYWCLTFILFHNKTEANGFETKLDAVSKEYLQHEVDGTDATIAYQMEALPDVHFGKQKLFDTPKSSRSNIYIFSIVAIFILLVACVNYANLSMVQALKRNTEAGIRKILGALSSQLLKQHLFESFIVFFLSFIFALAIAFLFMPYLNQLTGKQLSYHQFLNFPLLSIFLLTVILLYVLAGSYPAMLLSSAKPAQALKGHERIIQKNRLRNILIVFQFTASIALIISTKIVYDQWNVLTHANPGFNKEQVLVIDIPKEKSLVTLTQVVKNDFAALPFVVKSSLVGYNSLPTSSMDIDSYEVEHNGDNTTRIFNNITVDEDYLDVLEIEIKQGCNFSKQDIENNESVILVNESLVAAVGWRHPLDQTLYQDSKEYKIVGVVKDFHFNSLHKSIEPIVIHLHPNSAEKLMVRLSQADYKSIKALEENWKKTIGHPLEGAFLDSYFNEQYKNEKTTQYVLLYFSIFTIIIACLGLFGLVAISTLHKTKEFGIRKILGGKFQNIAFLVLKEFFLLVVFAAILSVPIAWWSMTLWLREFSYKTMLTVNDFIFPILITFGIAVLSMAYHIIKASRVNPIESIKQE